MAKWMTGKFAMDPSSASLTALYNTVENDKKDHNKTNLHTGNNSKGPAKSKPWNNLSKSTWESLSIWAR